MMKNKKMKKIIIFCIILVFAWNTGCVKNNIVNNENKKEEKKVDRIKDEERILIKSDYNVILPESMDELVEKSDLVVRCSVDDIIETRFVKYLSDEIIEILKEDGAFEYEYSHIWTYCSLNILEIYKGNCDEKIIYRYIGGKIQKYEQEAVHALKIGGEYILFLQKVPEENVYSNAIDPDTVFDIKNGIIVNELLGNVLDEDKKTLGEVEEIIEKIQE